MHIGKHYHPYPHTHTFSDPLLFFVVFCLFVIWFFYVFIDTGGLPGYIPIKIYPSLSLISPSSLSEIVTYGINTANTVMDLNNSIGRISLFFRMFLGTLTCALVHKEGRFVATARCPLPAPVSLLSCLFCFVCFGVLLSVLVCSAACAL
jgi:hypothetical protein